MTSQIVLIIDDDTSHREELASILCDEGYVTVQAGTCDEALQLAETAPPGLVLFGADLKKENPSRFISDLKELSPAWECLISSETTDLPSTYEASPLRTFTTSTNPEEVVFMIRDAFSEIQKKKLADEYKTFVQNSPAYLSALIQNSADAVFVKSKERRYLAANRIALKWFGLSAEELLGKRDSETVTPFSTADAAEKDEQVLKGQPVDEEVSVDENKMSVIRRVLLVPVRGDNDEVIGIIGIGKDISEKRVTENKPAQTQNTEAATLLTGGIAHDFNNILGTIVGFVELARLNTPENSRTRSHLDEVMKASQRASKLIKQILSFNRQDTHNVKPVRIATIIEEYLHRIRASLPSSIEVYSNIKNDSGVVSVDAAQMHQVLMNLASNAEHAMAERGGKLFVTLENTRVTLENTPAGAGINPGSYVQITIRDTGRGMDDETLTKIFDPYFTTKKESGGSGLGLAVVHRIVLSTGGAVTVKSKTGEGSTFFIYLPQIETVADKPQKQASPASAGHERILYVDDESMLADIGKKMLEKFGYEVVAQTDPVSALDIFRSTPDEFDLIITDQTMPQITGVELARQIMSIRPGIPVIICSGFTESPEYEEATRLGIEHFLRKPIVMKDFAAKVRNVLDERQAEA